MERLTRSDINCYLKIFFRSGTRINKETNKSIEWITENGKRYVVQKSNGHVKYQDENGEWKDEPFATREIRHMFFGY